MARNRRVFFDFVLLTAAEQRVNILRYKAVIFDLDGTLLNTLEDLADATNLALDKHGWPKRNLNEIRQFVGNGVAKLIHLATPDGISAEEEAACLEDFRVLYKGLMTAKTGPYPGISELLRTLSERHVWTAVVSNKFDAAVKELADFYFPGLLRVAAGELESQGIPKKPHPAMVEKVLRELGVTKAEAVYVGDSDVDILTARNAGLPCISVLWGFRDREFLTGHGATTFAGSPAELLELL